jgi:hypothetical protein
MKPIILLFTVLFFQNVIYAQYETLILYYADEPLEIEIPEGKVLEVGTFTDIVGNRLFSLSLLKSGRETTVLASASFQVARDNGALMPFAGPAVLKVYSPLSSYGKAALTYRIFKNEDPDAEPVRPIIQVQTICRCKKGR